MDENDDDELKRLIQEDKSMPEIQAQTRRTRRAIKHRTVGLRKTMNLKHIKHIHNYNNWAKWEPFVVELRSIYGLSFCEIENITGIAYKSLNQKYRKTGLFLKKNPKKNIMGIKFDDLHTDVQARIREQAERIKAQTSLPTNTTTSTTTTTTSSYDSDAEDSEMDYEVSTSHVDTETSQFRPWTKRTKTSLKFTLKKKRR